MSVSASSQPLAERLRRASQAGRREVLAVAPGTAAWALVTGVAMVKGGLPVDAALLMSALVYAASAQLAVLPLLVAGSPLIVVLATATCVNLRFVIYSAQWREFFLHLPLPKRLLWGYLSTDMGYAMCMQRYPQPPVDDADRAERLAYYKAGTLLQWTVWQVPATIGIFAADHIPTQWGLGFAGVIALLALVFGQLQDRRMIVAGIAAATAAVAAYALPYKLHVVVAIVVAVALGLWLDEAGRGGGSRRVTPLGGEAKA